MNEFLQTALTFPTVVYSVLLAVSALYWLLAATGLADADAADALTSDGDASGAAAMLSRLGVAGVPVMVVATVFSLAAWLGTYFVHLLVLRTLPEGLRLAAGIATLLGMAIPATAATSLVLRPMARTLARLRPAPVNEVSLIGQAGVLITQTVSGDHGQASVDDGGAGLVLQVRHDEPNELTRGDRVVLIEHLEGQNAYRVVSEQQLFDR
ncbi:MAG TPA: hypothetical protein VEQ60_16040 [Longimicrobium sp.]|nr:hypothetical protein [Longimicrobium sp.]